MPRSTVFYIRRYDDMKHLKGVVCATITPMLPDGSVDMKSLVRFCDFLNQNKIHCLYPNGTNGESLSLTFEERTEIAKTIVKQNNGQATVYIQCGAATVKESYENVRVAKSCGADGAGLMTPVFFGIDEAAMREYYEKLLDEITDFPIYVYNIFTRTGNDFSAELLKTLMDKYQNLHGIKFSYPDIDRIRAYVNAPANRKADALIGCDMLASNCCAAGGSGWVSGPAAVFGKIHTALYDAIVADDKEKIAFYQKAIIDVMKEIEGIPEIPAIKYMLKRRGVIDHDTCRAPFRKLTDAEKKRLDIALDRYIKTYES